MQISTLLYVSQLALDAPVDAVASITRQARVRNEQDGVTGLLMFDGANFAQMIEGPADAISDLVERIRNDRRHRSIEVLSFGTRPWARRFADWKLGYLAVESEDQSIERLRGLRDTGAWAAFDVIAQHLDVGVASALPFR